MMKKTKNIIAVIIIIVLTICLAFTLKDCGRKNNYVRNMHQPNIMARRGIERRNNRFNWPKQDNKSETKEKDEDKNEDTDVKENNSCDCTTIKPYSTDKRTSVYYDDIETFSALSSSNNKSSTLCLVGVETFLLGGAVMFLILNNINSETKEKNSKTK